MKISMKKEEMASIFHSLLLSLCRSHFVFEFHLLVLTTLQELLGHKTLLEKQKIDTGTLSEDAQHAIGQLQRDLEQAEERKGLEDEQLRARQAELEEARERQREARGEIERELEALRAQDEKNKEELESKKNESTKLQQDEAKAAKERDELLKKHAELEASRQEADRDIKELAGAIQAARELMAGTAAEAEQLRGARLAAEEAALDRQVTSRVKISMKKMRNWLLIFSQLPASDQWNRHRLPRRRRCRLWPSTRSASPSSRRSVAWSKAGAPALQRFGGSSGRLATNFHSTNEQATNFHSTNEQANNFHSTNKPTTNFHSTNEQATNFHSTHEQATKFHSTNEQATNFLSTTGSEGARGGAARLRRCRAGA